MEYDKSPAVPASRKQLGTYGESDSLRYLEEIGYRIVDANVRPLGGMRRGEIDIVAWDGEYLVFVEVKTRRRASFRTRPSEAVDRRKRKQIVTLANAYLAKHRLDEVSCRFDVVEVLHNGVVTEFNLIVNAFDAADI